MKKFIMVLLLLVIPNFSFAGECRVYEYAEIKDMNETELSTAMMKAREDGLFWITSSNKLLEIDIKYGSTPASNRARAEEDKKFDVCFEQEFRFRDMLTKKYPKSAALKYPEAEKPK
jgi:hypothetical protein